MSPLLSLVKQVQDAAVRIGGEALLPISGAIILIFLIWGGIQYMNNPEAGKKTLIGAIIGLVIVALSYWLFAVLISTY